jgi:hypothetical protein
MIFANFSHPPKPATGNATLPTVTETVTKAVAAYPGFPGYVLFQPDQWNGEGEWGYPINVDGKDCKNAAIAADTLWYRVGGCKPRDLPLKDGPIATLMDKLRPAKVIICDFGSGLHPQIATPDDTHRESDRYQRIITANGQVFCAEANARRDWIKPSANVWICAEWFHFSDVPIPGAMNDCDEQRWRVRDWLAAHPDTKVIVEVTSETRKNLGFSPTANDPSPNPWPDWATAKFEIAKAYHYIDPERVIVSVRMGGKPGDGMSPAQVAALRSLNA